MKKEIEDKVWFTTTNHRIWETKEGRFLTLPDAVEYTNLNQSALRQRIRRKKVEVVKLVSSKRYVFVPLEKCEEWRKDDDITVKIATIQKLKNVTITDDDLLRLLEWKKAQEESEKTKNM